MADLLTRLRNKAERAVSSSELLGVADLAMTLALKNAQTPKEVRAVLERLPEGDPRHQEASQKLQSLQNSGVMAA